MPPRTVLDRVKWFIFRHFERVLVLVLVASMLGIHWLIDYKIAFLSFYYLPVILAGFFLGRNTAVWSSVFIVSLVIFFQAVEGLNGQAGFGGSVLFTLIPWAGFLILTGYVVGRLAQQRQASMDELRQAYVTMLELLTFNLEADDKHQSGHSRRVAQLAAQLAQDMGLPDGEIENIRVAALLHEIGPHDPRFLRLLGRFPGENRTIPLASAVHGATDILEEYGRYYELVGDEWPVDHLTLSFGAKILAVADAFETLQTPTDYRQAFARWSALEEIERGAGRTFSTPVVRALRRVVAQPERAQSVEAFEFLRN